MRTRPPCMAARMSRSERTDMRADYQRRRQRTGSGPDLALGVALTRRRATAWAVAHNLALDFHALGQQRVDLLAQLLQAFIALVDAGESDVSDLVKLSQLVHGHRTDVRGRNL